MFTRNFFLVCNGDVIIMNYQQDINVVIFLSEWWEKKGFLGFLVAIYI
jgi:hypothetical protein